MASQKSMASKLHVEGSGVDRGFAKSCFLFCKHKDIGNREYREEKLVSQAKTIVKSSPLPALDVARIYCGLEYLLIGHETATARRICDVVRHVDGMAEAVERIVRLLEAGDEESLVEATYLASAQTYDHRVHGRFHVSRVAQVVLAFGDQPLLEARRVADLGCGSGIAGSLIREHGFSGWLHGVDLSAEMLELARKKNVYDALVCQTIDEFAAEHPDEFDFACMIGICILTPEDRLDALMRACHRLLAPGGSMVFNAATGTLSEGFGYVHKRARILKAAQLAGLQLSIKDGRDRTQFLAQKPG